MSEQKPSKLAAYLLQLWAWGLISPQKVQTIAALAMEDMDGARGGQATYDDLEALASLGSRGKHSNNCNRDLMDKLKQNRLPEPQGCSMPVHSENALQYKMRMQYMLWPHEMFAHIYEHYKEAWVTRICPSSDSVRDFWNRMRGNPQLEGHPVRHRADHQTKCVPLGIHADGVPVVGVGKAWSQSLDVFSWSSLLGSGSTLESNFLIFCIFQCLLVKKVAANTMSTFYKFLHWSLTCLWHGRWPDQDANGRPYPAGSVKHGGQGLHSRAGCMLACGQ